MTQEVILWRHPATLRPPPHDARQHRDPEFLRTLGADIKNRGMRAPVVCRKVGEDLEVVCGESRRQAALLAGVEEIPVRIIQEPLQPGELLLEQLLENELRRDFSYLERVSLYVELIKENGWSQVQLATAVNKSAGEVNKALAIKGRLPEDLIALVQSGKLPVSVAYVLSKLPDHQQMREVAQRYEMGTLCRDGVEAEVARRLGNRKLKVKPIGFRDGNVLIQVPGDWTWEAFGLLVQKLLGASRKGEKLALPFSMLPDLYRKE